MVVKVDHYSSGYQGIVIVPAFWFTGVCAKRWTIRGLHMLTALLICLTGTPVLPGTLWLPAPQCVLLLLATWTVSVGLLIHSDLTPGWLRAVVLTGVAGILGSVSVLAIPDNVLLAANVATLVLFNVFLEGLKKRDRRLQAKTHLPF